jgi:hypothetical protein
MEKRPSVSQNTHGLNNHLTGRPNPGKSSVSPRQQEDYGSGRLVSQTQHADASAGHTIVEQWIRRSNRQIVRFTHPA